MNAFTQKPDTSKLLGDLRRSAQAASNARGNKPLTVNTKRFHVYSKAVPNEQAKTR